MTNPKPRSKGCSELEGVATLFASFLCIVGIFTISWDRLCNITVGSFNLKIGVMAFACSALLSAGSMFLGRRSQIRIPRWLWIVSAAMLVVLTLSSLLAIDVKTGLLGTATVLVGAIIPAFAVLANSQVRGEFERMLTWFVWGAVFACLFGLYQLVAFYTGLPQFIQYEGVSGGLGRISSFAYEPAYLGYFLVTALVIALSRKPGLHTTWRYAQVGLIFVTLVLLNSRAVFLTLPLLFILIRPIANALISPRKLWIGVGVGVASIVAFCVAVPSVPRILLGQFLSIFDPNEVSSNAPRLQLFSAAYEIASKHPWLGVGPSNFGIHIAELDYGQYFGVSLNKMIVNNIWLQSLMDGGIALALLHVSIIVFAVMTLYFSKSRTTRIIVSGWIAVIGVGGMVVSNFYDAKLWVVLALAVGANELQRQVASPGPDAITGEPSETGLLEDEAPQKPWTFRRTASR